LIGVQVTVRAGNNTLTAQSNDLKVGGTNPGVSTLAAAAPNNVTFRRPAAFFAKF
jgi:hypothetical protein